MYLLYRKKYSAIIAMSNSVEFRNFIMKFCMTVIVSGGGGTFDNSYFDNFISV